EPRQRCREEGRPEPCERGRARGPPGNRPEHRSADRPLPRRAAFREGRGGPDTRARAASRVRRHPRPSDDAMSAYGRHLLAAPLVPAAACAVGIALAAAFARSGTTHLLAISGFNMTLVATAVALLARGRLRPPLTAVVTVSSVAAYSVLVGLGPSVLRAALMAGVASLALAYGRRAATANALALAVAAMLLIDPGAIADVGFELSALA